MVIRITVSEAFSRTDSEAHDEMLTDIRYIDDDRIINWSTPMVSVSVSGMRTGQAYPYWWPIYKDGTSGIMPYVFNDPNGAPPYNYYLTYQLPGDPIHYKVGTVNKSSFQRFADSGVPAWYSPDGRSPDPNDPNERIYFITNPAPWKPSFVTTGTWQQFQDIPAQRNNSQYFKENYITNSAGTGNDTAKWIFDIPKSADYVVSAWWPALSTNATNTPFTVKHAGGTTTVPMNQTINGRRWNQIGQFHFDVNEYTVLLTDNVSSGNIVADGIRIAHVNNPPEVIQSDFIVLPSALTSLTTLNPAVLATAKLNINCYGPAPLKVTFYNLGTGDLTGREWNLGDGYTNTTRDTLEHEYINPGTYTVSLRVDGPAGSSTKTKTGYIQVWPKGTQQTPPLRAEFATLSQYGQAPLGTMLLDVSSGDLRRGITYTPVEGFSGNVELRYTVKDNEGLTSNEAVVSIVVGNNPVAENDWSACAVNSSVKIHVLDNDVAPKGTIEPNTVQVAGNPSHGIVDVNSIYGTIAYTPTTGFSGQDAFTYRVADNNGLVSNAATVTIAVGNSPVAKDDKFITGTNQSKVIAITKNDVDADGTVDPNTVTVAVNPAHGAVDVNNNSATVTYIPITGFTGQDTFTYTVKDNNNLTSNQATVTIIVGNTPVAENDKAVTAVGSEVNILIHDNDADSNGKILPETTSIVSGPSSGSVVVHDSWLWDFGDGQTSHERHPIHIYMVPGNYTVKLTVTDKNGNKSTEEKPNYIRAVIFEKSIDNVDYPKTHSGGYQGNKTYVKANTLDISKEQFRYNRMLYDSCNSADYYMGTFDHGLLFYTVTTSGAEGSLQYLRSYLEGKSNQEIWDDIQHVEAAYDYYNFNLRPDQQQEDTTTQTLSMKTNLMTALPTSVVDSTAIQDSAVIKDLANKSVEEAVDSLEEPQYLVNDKRMTETITATFKNKEKEAVENAIAQVQKPAEGLTDSNTVTLNSQFTVAKKILQAFPEESIKLLLDTYESGDTTSRQNVINVIGIWAAKPSVREILRKALDDKTVCINENPELVGKPLRICDIAYNQLVLNLKIKNVLRVIGSSMNMETRDYHINILKSKL